MTASELEKSDWYINLPAVIKAAVNICPPMHLYKFVDTEKECYIVSYEEPETNELSDVTVTVQKTGNGGVTLSRALHTNKVFGVKLDRLAVKSIGWV